MHILFEELAAPQRAGGVEAACAGLAAWLAKLGHEVIRHDGTDALPSGWQPDLVHVHGIWSPTLMACWRKWRTAGLPCVVTVHGMLEPWALAHKKWKKRVAWLTYQKRMLQTANCLHATSEREAGNLRALGLKPPIATIPWGVEGPGRPNVELAMLNDELEEIRHETSTGVTSSPIQNSTFNIQNFPTRTALFVGRIYPVKGLPMLVEAWASLRPEGWRMKIVGPDEAGHLAEVQALIQQAGLAAEFEFVGPLSGAALDQAYESADLYIQPSHTENFGIAVAEAMAHGLPVITTHGAPWKLLEEQHCGWWVPVSVEGIASALDDAIRQSPEELAAMGDKGRTVVAERFSWDRIAREMIACYEWVLGQGPRPGCVRD